MEKAPGLGSSKGPNRNYKAVTGGKESSRFIALFRGRKIMLQERFKNKHLLSAKVTQSEVTSQS